MKNGIVMMVILALLVLLGGFGCGGVGGGESPSEVVKACYMAANEGNYSKAKGYLSSELKEAVEGTLGALAGGFKGIMDDLTKNGTIERIEIIREEIRGEGATVYFTLYFRDGSQKDDDEPLIKEGGRWKITIE